MNETLGAIFGVYGTLLLAKKGPWAGWGFVAYLVSNACWIAFSLEHGHKWMLGQQCAFLVSSLVGVWVWLIKERVNKCFDALFHDPYDRSHDTTGSEVDHATR